MASIINATSSGITSTADSTGIMKVQSNGVTVSALAWGSYNFVASGSVPTLRSACNISSITRNSAGNYTFAFTNALADANYSVLGLPYYSVALPSSMITYTAKSTSSVTLAMGYVASGGSNATGYDYGCDFVVFGNG
jgi:hypothetical protein